MIVRLRWFYYNKQFEYLFLSCAVQYSKVPVISERGLPLDEKEILFMLKYVLENSKVDGPPVGILSSAHRDAWSKAYKELLCVYNGGEFNNFLYVLLHGMSTLGCLLRTVLKYKNILHIFLLVLLCSE